MTARPTMELERKELGERVIHMAALVEQNILRAIGSLQEMDSERARAVIAGDEEIDEAEEEIKDLCLQFLATQQPLAGDLRYVISIMKVIRDLERIGDHCEDIAKNTLKFENETLYKELIDIPRMADMASAMVKNAIDSFVHSDLRLARRVWKSDEDVDEIFHNLQEELIGIAEKEPAKVKQSIMFLFIAAHLERIADYATNISEETVFVIQGSVVMV